MTLDEAKKKFIQTWGGLGAQWGINKTMAQLHALLFISAQPLSTEDIMETLQISRGNVNMNVRELIDWGLVYRVNKTGDRKDYYQAEKDVWKIAKLIVRERKKRELEPIIEVLTELKKVEGDKKSEEYQSFVESMTQLKNFSETVNNSVDKMIKADENWLGNLFLSMLKK
ncbi:GbsR/MarR family transcriptional regulator [Thermoflexibacter ruber]|uniref:HTH-type transcriptional regulator n=1 Tax=Thermoflexibacter ruber TaxID=1003 RepID=A0A1I2JBH0_9BACT|nr:MarR family transcriptional regulator [Thermoflexibacter ruber]SFF51448.1 DNA-binding transcriptional regulator GbsR, MarR family [Thermoflexibacter ruber]